jgi:hypothetical protein
VLARPLARLLGIVAPHGKAPIYVRLLLDANRQAASRAAARLVAFNPDRVVFAHGRWFERDAAAQLRRSLAWLLPPTGAANAEGAEPEGFVSMRAPATKGLVAAGAVLATIGIASYLGRRRVQAIRPGRAGKSTLQANAEKALKMKEAAGPQAHIPPHRTSHQGGVQGPQIGYTDTALGKEPTYTSNLKRSHNARTGDA